MVTLRLSETFNKGQKIVLHKRGYVSLRGVFTIFHPQSLNPSRMLQLGNPERERAVLPVDRLRLVRGSVSAAKEYAFLP